MIASPAGLPVLGPVERKVTYRLYPSKTVRDELLRTRWVHCFLWNLALEERRRAWKEEKRSIGFAEQCRFYHRAPFLQRASLLDQCSIRPGNAQEVGSRLLGVLLSLPARRKAQVPPLPAARRRLAAARLRSKCSPKASSLRHLGNPDPGQAPTPGELRGSKIFLFIGK
ncbi:helix-turn-helix domain-containing protein [Candidatus Methylacidiphilum fumarolicum]|uniref:helix-turn-helix domain-containing protein n=1 Tax=Candidatus Methylacidiphilum fumarolicum TaxID=591154 RepID=UPI0034D9651D